MIRATIHVILTYGLILIAFSGCCKKKDGGTIIENPGIFPYLYFAPNSWWEFEGPEGERERITSRIFKREPHNMGLDDCGVGFWANRCCSSGPFVYRAAMNFLGTGSKNFQIGGDYSAQESLWLNLWDEAAGYRYSTGFAFFGKPHFSRQALQDSAIVLSIAGTQMDSVRQYKLYYTFNTTSPPWVQGNDSLDLYLAPNIGPVLVRFSDSTEWKLADYSVIKPKL